MPLPENHRRKMGAGQFVVLTYGQRGKVLTLLERHLPDTAAWVYGSRAKLTSNPQSDHDLVVLSKPDQEFRAEDLRGALEESGLPFSVDLFVWDEAPESSRTQTREYHFVLAVMTRKAQEDLWPSYPLAMSPHTGYGHQARRNGHAAMEQIANVGSCSR